MLYPLVNQSSPRAVNLDRVNAVALCTKTRVSAARVFIYVNVHGMASPIELTFDDDQAAKAEYNAIIAASAR